MKNIEVKFKESLLGKTLLSLQVMNDSVIFTVY